MQHFDKNRQRILNNIQRPGSPDHDRSLKKNLDEPIRDFLNCINECDDYYTTSSCSGRISIFCKHSSAKKTSGKLLYTNHGLNYQQNCFNETHCESFEYCKEEVDNLLELLNTRLNTKESLYNNSCNKEACENTKYYTGSIIWLSFEAFVVHVKCRSLAAAERGLFVAVNLNGLDHSSITSSRKSILLAIRGAQNMHVPLGVVESNNRINYYFDPSQVSKLVLHANLKMISNWSSLSQLMNDWNNHIVNGRQKKYEASQPSGTIQCLNGGSTIELVTFLRSVQTYKRFGDTVLFSENIANIEQTITTFGEYFLIFYACRHLGTMGRVENTAMRIPQVRILYPRKRRHEIIHVEDGIKFIFDVTRIMFSSGNGTERMRIPKLISSKFQDRSDGSICPEIIVDMFCGIGYFTLPILSKCSPRQVQKIWGVDINPMSLQYLNKSVKHNSIDTPSRLETLRANSGDKEALKFLENQADRVILGLIPSSAVAWENSIKIAKPSGCIIHIHDLGRNREDVMSRIPEAFKASSSDILDVNVINVEKVKSYSPKKYHFVIDLHITKNLGEAST